MRYHADVGHGWGKYRLRHARNKLGWRGRVDVHHIVPKQFRHHPTLSAYDYDVEADYNFVFCPTRRGASQLFLRNERPIHEVRHNRYNAFVAHELGTRVESHAQLLALLITLHRICRSRCPSSWTSSERSNDTRFPTR